MKLNTKGRYRAAAPGRTIPPMDATIHTLIASHLVKDRMAEATSQRAVRKVETRRHWFTRKSKPTVAADLKAPVTTKQPTFTSM